MRCTYTGRKNTKFLVKSVNEICKSENLLDWKVNERPAGVKAPVHKEVLSL